MVFLILLQVQNQLNAFIVLAAVLWCVLGAVTMILQEHSTQQAVVALWYAPSPFIMPLLHHSYGSYLSKHNNSMWYTCHCYSAEACGKGSVRVTFTQWHGRGWTVSITQVLLMASPLSGLLTAIRQRTSANFHLGVCAAGLLSSSLWGIYAMVSLLLLHQIGCMHRTGQPTQGSNLGN